MKHRSKRVKPLKSYAKIIAFLAYGPPQIENRRHIHRNNLWELCKIPFYDEIGGTYIGIISGNYVKYHFMMKSAAHT